ncbi:Ras-related GTP-binding protein A [Diplonema papillatum]|nr:Ras-related GTP-binding protein A [Diplonema papillatum]
MSSEQLKRKVLLMGQAHSGKTSMRSIIFAHWVARDTRKLGPTTEVEYSHVRFLGNLVLNLWDCGGQVSFVKNYLSTQEKHVFSNVAVLIYVFDIEMRPPMHSDEEWQNQLIAFKRCLASLLRNSPNAKVFCLVHKMDVIAFDRRADIYTECKQQLEEQVEEALQLADVPAHSTQKITCYPTSIWDESLYRAWSMIVYSLVPQIETLQQLTDTFCSLCQADEVVLFERQTFLTILNSRRPSIPAHPDDHRHEKISNIIKQFKLTAFRQGSQVQSMEVTNSRFAAFVDQFTSNTYVMVVLSDKTIPRAATKINIALARQKFEQLIETSSELASVM